MHEPPPYRPESLEYWRSAVLLLTNGEFAPGVGPDPGDTARALELRLAGLEAQIVDAERFVREQLNGKSDRDLTLARLRMERFSLLRAVGREDLATGELSAAQSLDEDSEWIAPQAVPHMLVPSTSWWILMDDDPDAAEPFGTPEEMLADWRESWRLVRLNPLAWREAEAPRLIAGFSLAIARHGHLRESLKGLRWAVRKAERRYGKTDLQTMHIRAHLAQLLLAIVLAPSRFSPSEAELDLAYEHAPRAVLRSVWEHYAALGPAHPSTLHIVDRLLDWLLAERIEAALPLATLAFRSANRSRFSLQEMSHRSRWRRGQADIFSIALMRAAYIGDPHLVIELIEAERSQGIPTPRLETNTADTLSVDLAARVSVTGSQSTLARVDQALDEVFVPAVQPPHSEISLRPWAERTAADRRAWVWGWWENSAFRVGYLMIPDVDGPGFEVSVFSREIDDGSAVQRFADALRRPDEPLDEFLERSDLTRSERSERELLLDVGRELIPARLRDEVARRIRTGDAPLTVLILPSTACSRVPFAALGIDDEDLTVDTPTGRDSRRFVEGATALLTPGVQFTDATRRRHHDRWNQPVEGKIIKLAAPQADDREWSLPWAGASCPGTAIPLAKPNISGTEAAEALASVTASSVLVCAGHAEPGTVDQPALANLVLDGGFSHPSRRLYAGQMMALEDPRGPACVVLAACSTWGDYGAPDWLGLAPAFMWIGAQHVVATLWNVIDLESTAAFHRQLTEVLAAASAEDRPAVLRTNQLDCLGRQRAAPYRPSSIVRDAHDLAERDSAYVWGALTMLCA